MAFPTTSLLDDFNRANIQLNGDGNWTSPMITGDSALSVESNVVSGAGSFASAYWSVAAFGANQEAYVTVSTKPGTGEAVEVWGRITGGGGSSVSAYFVDVSIAAGADQWRIWKSVSGTQSALGASAVSQEINAGDSIGIEISGSTITAYYKTGGTWSSVTSVSDSDVTGTGNIGMVLQGTTARLDDFSGGTLAASGPTAAQIMPAPIELGSTGGMIGRRYR